MNGITVDSIKGFIDRNVWTFSKTYAKFAPHEYVVKQRLSAEDQKLFEEIAIFIREHGISAMYGKATRQYYIIDDRYYWTMGDPIPDTIILNRAKMSDYIFEETDAGLKVRRRRAGEDIQAVECVRGKYQKD